MNNFTIRIAGIDYKITTIDSKYADTNMGKMRADTDEIFINSSLGYHARNRVILHESIHWILRNAGLDDHVENEKITSIIEAGMYAFIRDNRNFIMNNILESELGAWNFNKGVNDV